MKRRNEIKNYKNQNQLDLEKIIDEYSGYIYKIIASPKFPSKSFPAVIKSLYACDLKVNTKLKK